MATIDHVTIRVSDLPASRQFYDHAFTLLGISAARDADVYLEWGDFSISAADNQRQPTRGLHIAFTAASQDLVDSWWHGLTAAGYRAEGAPGLRPHYSPDYYGAFILDNQNNSIEAVSHTHTQGRPNGLIDHLWIRVKELKPTKRFYAAIAPAVGIEARDHGERFRLVTDQGSVTFLEGPPTENLHLALGVSDQQTVREFHAAAIAAGATDNGRPGERPEYHPGYYGAYVLDPAGTNLEAVFHDRNATRTATTWSS